MTGVSLSQKSTGWILAHIVMLHKNSYSYCVNV